MAYPYFPLGGAAMRPMFFTTFDPTFMGQANQVLANGSLHSAGPAAIYNGSLAQPPSYWTPSAALFNNAGNYTRTQPYLWAQRFGLSRAYYITYAGGATPS